ncbi:MAG: hypothetical protein V4473_01170 [Patescibacteria group bacterium]
MEPNTSNIEARMQLLEQKIDSIYISVEKTRNYFKWSAIITVVLFVLPLIGILFVAPSFISNYTTTLQDLSQ